MNKSFTKDDIIKKHETNVKSATTGIALAGVLGLIYVVRYFITGNFDFHFSLSVPEMMLKFGHWEAVPTSVSYGVTAAFFALYVLTAVLAVKDKKLLPLALSVYAVDTLCLFFFIFTVSTKFSQYYSTDLYIEVIIHFFNILFLSVGVYSHEKLKKLR